MTGINTMNNALRNLVKFVNTEEILEVLSKSSSILEPLGKIHEKINDKRYRLHQKKVGQTAVLNKLSKSLGEYLFCEVPLTEQST